MLVNQGQQVRTREVISSLHEVQSQSSATNKNQTCFWIRTVDLSCPLFFVEPSLTNPTFMWRRWLCLKPQLRDQTQHPRRCVPAVALLAWSCNVVCCVPVCLAAHRPHQIWLSLFYPQNEFQAQNLELEWLRLSGRGPRARSGSLTVRTDKNMDAHQHGPHAVFLAWKWVRTQSSPKSVTKMFQQQTQWDWNVSGS